ncbi:carbon-nitrogen hydrolase family protein [Leptolinea tardivitalis]|uniref:Nitrilase n=1 Tax=Leptolinea tardivitalis TaxID=229920 RepID=A0A0P6XLJ1_9CHLR|nr:carbon-nitrogen hydrolase family protein [Leptolinea tardivitalis]KPL72669.1 nitrilase [Leptolinea tardivitalis]GAP20993.1 predicted amidohydrolase [Leptolinea tardivitalis]
MGTSSIIKAAVIQASPVLFNRDSTVEKACTLIHEASSQGAQLILLPESFIPAYPRGLSFGAVVGRRSEQGRDLYKRYWENSVDVPGPVTDILGEAVRTANVYLGIGITERDKGSLYCTLLYFGPDGRLLGKHRKVKPTASERLIWGEDDGSTLTAVPTEIGCIGGLICWENYMPLARMAMYSKGVQIYLAPTADSRDTWQATMRHIALEGRCFVLGCNQYVTRSMYPADLPGYEELANQPDVMCRGGSVIISPMGEILAGPLFDKEGILTADLNMGEIIRGKFDFDVAGHYNRPDIFRFSVNENNH